MQTHLDAYTTHTHYTNACLCTPLPPADEDAFPNVMFAFLNENPLLTTKPPSVSLVKRAGRHATGAGRFGLQRPSLAGEAMPLRLILGVGRDERKQEAELIEKARAAEEAKVAEEAKAAEAAKAMAAAKTSSESSSDAMTLGGKQVTWGKDKRGRDGDRGKERDRMKEGERRRRAGLSPSDSFELSSSTESFREHTRDSIRRRRQRRGESPLGSSTESDLVEEAVRVRARERRRKEPKGERKRETPGGERETAALEKATRVSPADVGAVAGGLVRGAMRMATLEALALEAKEGGKQQRFAQSTVRLHPHTPTGACA